MLDNAHIKVGVSYRWGGAVDHIVFDKGGGTWTGEMVANGSENSIDGAGLLLQAAFWRVGNGSVSYDDPAFAVANDKQAYEQVAPPNSMQPACMNAKSSQPVAWNPTQGGSQPGCSPGDNGFSATNCFGAGTPAGEVCEATPACLNGASVKFTSKYVPWYPLDGVYAVYPQLINEPNVWEDSTVTLSSVSDRAASIDFQSRFRLSRKDANGANVHEAFVVQAQERILFGAAQMTRTYVYDPLDTTDPCYHMKLRASLPAWGASTSDGWRGPLEAAGKWKPYVMMSDAASSFYVLMYNEQNDANAAMARRLIAFAADPANQVPGNVMGFATFFYKTPRGDGTCEPGLSTDYWSAPVVSHLIVGRSEEDVMGELRRVSHGSQGVRECP